MVLSVFRINTIFFCIVDLAATWNKWTHVNSEFETELKVWVICEFCFQECAKNLSQCDFFWWPKIFCYWRGHHRTSRTASRSGILLFIHRTRYNSFIRVTVVDIQLIIEYHGQIKLWVVGGEAVIRIEKTFIYQLCLYHFPHSLQIVRNNRKSW